MFFVRPHDGVTRRLEGLARRAAGGLLGCTVLLEGPYGGIAQMGSEKVDTNVMIVAGGSGGGFALGVFAEALRALESGAGKGNVQVVFACRSKSMARWFREESDALMKQMGVAEGHVLVDIHETSLSSAHPGQTGGGNARDKELEPGIALLPPDNDIDIDNNREGQKTEKDFSVGRPDLPARIAEASKAAEAKKLAIYACGPASMLFDVRNAAADAQRGNPRGEVCLHTETFSW